MRVYFRLKAHRFDPDLCKCKVICKVTGLCSLKVVIHAKIMALSRYPDPIVTLEKIHSTVLLQLHIKSLNI